MSHSRKKPDDHPPPRSIATRHDELARLEQAAIEMLRDMAKSIDCPAEAFAETPQPTISAPIRNHLAVPTFPPEGTENHMSQPVIRIRHEDHLNSGRYVAVLPGTQGEAELTWRAVGTGIILADHTFAPPAMRGSGAAGALVDRLIADAREKGLRIVPSCSYVRAQFDQHPEWAELRAAD